MISGKTNTNTKKNISALPFSIYISLAVAVICLALSILFPSKNVAENLTKNILFLVIVPALYIKFVLKENLHDFGLNIQNKKKGVILGILIFIILILAAAGYTRQIAFQEEYNLPGGIIKNFWYFVFYELVLVNFFIFIYEFFFRGFILFLLEKKIGFWAVAAQAAIFWIFLAITQNFGWAMVPVIVISLTSGLLTKLTRSIFYSYVISLIFSLLLDAYLIYSLK